MALRSIDQEKFEILECFILKKIQFQLQVKKYDTRNS